MNSFYVCIIFSGILLILISMILIAYDRKKGYDYTEKLEDKKFELETVISDADQMISEMNKFSDYIVTQIELKNEELNTNLKMAEERFERLEARISQSQNIESSLQPEILQEVAVNGNNYEPFKVHYKTRDKVVPINHKFKKVIQLSEDGISHTEIAKTLNMGKGEVQLILEMNK